MPATDEDQRALDAIKQTCTCNIALCFVRIGAYREAVDMATKAVRRDPRYAKALYRRAQAYRLLDEYDKAHADLALAVALVPGDAGIAEERRLLKQQQTNAERKEKEMWGSTSGAVRGGGRVNGGRESGAGQGGDGDNDIWSAEPLTSLNSGLPLEPLPVTAAPPSSTRAE